MEQKKKSSKQWRREIIADVERREAEKKKEKWRIRRCWLVIYGSTFSFSLLVLSIVLLNLYNDKVTFTNIILGLITINGGYCLAGYIIIKTVWSLHPIIPLKNDGKLKSIALPDCWKSSTGEKYKFNRIDDKQIVIDNDYVLARIFLFLFLFIIFLGLVYFADATPSKLSTEGFVNALLFLEIDVVMLWAAISQILKPWRRIVFDRVSKTITIPARFIFQKKETIPYDQAVVTLFGNYHAKTLSGKGEEEIVIANPRRSLGGIPLGIAGGIDAAKRFARFIQVYMEEEELPDMPEFEKYRNKEKQENAEIEKEIPIWKR